MTHRVLLGSGAQTLAHVATDALGRPTRVEAATYSIVDLTEGTTSGDRIVVASTAAAVSSISTTLSAVGGATAADARSLTVASTSGISEGDRLLLSAPDGGRREQIVVRSTTSSVIHTQRPVRGTYAVSSTVQGIEMTATFPAAVADDEDRAIRDGSDFQIVWSYAIDGQAYLVPELVSVERYSVAPWIGPDDVLRGHPALARRLSPGVLQDALAIATEEVTGELEASRINSAYYRPTTAGRIAVRYLALHYLFQQLGGDEDRLLADTFRERFKAQIHSMIEGRPEGARLVSRTEDTSRVQGNELDIFVPT